MTFLLVGALAFSCVQNGRPLALWNNWRCKGPSPFGELTLGCYRVDRVHSSMRATSMTALWVAFEVKLQESGGADTSLMVSGSF
jgi:hypothetical protein